MSDRPTSSDRDPQPDWEQSLIDLEESLSSLKQRYTQVRVGKQQKQDLQQRLAQLQTELQQVKQQLAVLEVELESRLLSWLTVKEPFWQAVRFGGLGFAIGWGLHWWLRR
ncbi:DUF2203 domain-containing protein [Roseofilum sp. BLCC_M91]|uniref:DUF2203 domain-containing protein n=1 Tax=Roseofilum halophilum BLCC-M91 TaxID=3022259 RepID=A0ABT7BIE9_9CYAN|nr:hypothetical protein [Roseofilum halophilum]MDJ1178961.1 DUF2203 domain-containing protein [Roseofilum halophilum BLCC-M91]